MIHPSALIDPGAQIGENVKIGPFTTVGPRVEIGDNTEIGSHCVIEGPTTIGTDNRIFSFCALGGEPQDKKFHGEETWLHIGNGNMIREYCTFNRGTADGGGVTRIGNDNWIMAYVHMAHDCIVGDDTIFANAASLAGHVTVEDRVILGGFTLVHQFCRIGAYSFTSMGSIINRDVPPYVTVAGTMASPRGINSEGLRRRGFSAERIMMIKKAYRLLYKSGLRLNEATESLIDLANGENDVLRMVDFIQESKRSIVR
ncbi:MAG: acyl-[acyl-carrier-protein]--UDP-N-acetylglucosam ine O-acyltransferase [Lysobacteraceae bacterium]|nr:MAG: acyl-[acyl-carrier-protein]--UDP-N-acetylglucosam ine O-acyltransferase [Xanthomonadaceae bacterium]